MLMRTPRPSSVMAWMTKNMAAGSKVIITGFFAPNWVKG
jgi:hypothetical protein